MKSVRIMKMLTMILCLEVQMFSGTIHSNVDNSDKIDQVLNTESDMKNDDHQCSNIDAHTTNYEDEIAQQNDKTD